MGRNRLSEYWGDRDKSEQNEKLRRRTEVLGRMELFLMGHTSEDVEFLVKKIYSYDQLTQVNKDMLDDLLQDTNYIDGLLQ